MMKAFIVCGGQSENDGVDQRSFASMSTTIQIWIVIVFILFLINSCFLFPHHVYLLFKVWQPVDDNSF